VLVISSPNTGTKPNAVMIKLDHAIITDVAVSCPLRPEDHASLAEFESVELVFVHIQKEYPLVLSVNVQVPPAYLTSCIHVEVLCNLGLETFLR
jgi:hypothetical protein